MKAKEMLLKILKESEASGVSDLQLPDVMQAVKRTLKDYGRLR